VDDTLPGEEAPLSDTSRVRLDRWLWAARFFKTRALAAAAIGGGKVLVAGARAKRAKLLGVGDRLRIRRGPFEYVVVVRALSEHRGPAAAAAALYAEDPEGKRLRERLAEQLRVAPSLRYEGKGRPTKKERREIEKLRGE
jgi:ribosome-associated heat shock protein Hsp15